MFADENPTIDQWAIQSYAAYQWSAAPAAYINSHFSSSEVAYAIWAGMTPADYEAFRRDQDKIARAERRAMESLVNVEEPEYDFSTGEMVVR